MDPFEKEYDKVRAHLETIKDTSLLDALETMRQLYNSACDELGDLSAQMPDY